MFSDDSTIRAPACHRHPIHDNQNNPAHDHRGTIFLPLSMSPHWTPPRGLCAVVTSPAKLLFPNPQSESVSHQGEPSGALSQRVLYPFSRSTPQERPVSCFPGRTNSDTIRNACVGACCRDPVVGPGCLKKPCTMCPGRQCGTRETGDPLLVPPIVRRPGSRWRWVSVIEEIFRRTTKACFPRLTRSFELPSSSRNSPHLVLGGCVLGLMLLAAAIGQDLLRQL